MDRIRRLITFWNWLPAFRVVAETEHLPTASEELRVSASALSRTIRLLEDALEVELFERRGRNLILTDAGHALLESVRRAMRMLDDGVEHLASATARGALRISCPGPFTSLYVLPALEALRESHPDLVPELASAGPEKANALLLSGMLDVALLDDPIPHENLVVERLAEIGYGLYCGKTHPLHDVETPTLEQITAHRFAAPPSGDDHWPPEIQREIGVRIAQLQLGVEFCAAGGFLAVLPDIIAGPYVQSGSLRRLPFERFKETSLYAVFREPLGSPTKLDVLLPELRRVAGGPA